MSTIVYFVLVIKKIRTTKYGQAPGTITFTGNRKVEKVHIHVLKYDDQVFEETALDNQKDFQIIDHPNFVDWYDIRGIHDIELIQLIGQFMGIHAMVLEDLVDVRQSPKFEEYPTGILLIVKGFAFDESKKKVIVEQVSLYFNDEILISFQEDYTDIFSNVRKRIHTGKGMIRFKKTDYLAFALLDDIVDQCFMVVDQFSTMIEELQNQILAGNPSSRKEIHLLRHELNKMYRYLTPLRETISRFVRSENPVIQKENTIYFNDLRDQVYQVAERITNQKDYLNGLYDLYLSEVSHKMNEIMKVLTIITTLFVPISFLAGLYGMNFEYIPELKYRYAYFILLGIMALVVILLLWMFRRKKWI